MRIEQGSRTIADLGYNKFLSKPELGGITSGVLYRGDLAGGDLKGMYPRPAVVWDNFRVNYASTSEPTYAAGRLYYNTTTGKLNVGGALGWEEITSTVVPSASTSPSASASPSASLSPST